MTVVLAEMTRKAADAILVGRQPGDVRVADAYPTEFVGYTPLDRPQSGRELDKAGFTMEREMDDDDEQGGVVRVQEWSSRPDHAVPPAPRNGRLPA